jgi:hypothetical protein
MKKVLLYFILLMAVVLAGTVAYVSISGLLTVFSGVGIVGLLFFSAIEISKIIATSAIHTYGKKIGWVYNGLLSLFIFIAMGITSMGVYGFLSSGYEKNASKADNLSKKIELIDNQIGLKEQSRVSINEQLLQTQKSINDLRYALGNNAQTRVDGGGNLITSSSNANRKAYESQLEIAIKSEYRLSGELNKLDSTITALSESKFELETTDELSELGPLKYLAEVTNSSMDNVMKWFILLLIIIGDPMAIIMIVIFNKIINDKKESDAVNDAVNDTVNDAVNDDISEGVNEGVTPRFDNFAEEIINHGDDYFDELPMDMPYKEKEEPKSEKQNNRTIRVEDLPEKNNRGFSVNIPDSKKNNIVERIGTNKEIRDNDINTVFFKKRNKK